MKQILVYGLTDTKGGVENFLLNYYRNMNRESIHFDFISNTKNTVYEKEFVDMGSKIYKVHSKKKNPTKFKRDIENVFKNNSSKYDAIWVNLCSLANIDYLKYAEKYGIKKRIVHSHNSANMFGWIKWILHNYNKRKIFNYATDFWACSNAAAKWFYNKEILESDKFRIINNAIDVSRFIYNEKIRNDYRDKLNISDKFVLGNIGRFHFQKNHEFLIDVFFYVQKLINNSVLLLVGCGELENKIKKKVKKLKIEDKVIFLGARNDVNNILQAIDIFLMPSKFEGLPVAAIEAQASGLPCVLSANITNEVRATEPLDFISIDEIEDAKKWCESILKFSIEYNRKDVQEEMKKNGYEITEEAKKIEEFILSI